LAGLNHRKIDAVDSGYDVGPIQGGENKQADEDDATHFSYDSLH
jgi:hypothetical protein